MLVGIVLILTTACVSVLAWVAKKVVAHDVSDAVLLEKVSGLGERINRVESDVGEIKAGVEELLEQGRNAA